MLPRVVFLAVVLAPFTLLAVQSPWMWAGFAGQCAAVAWLYRRDFPLFARAIYWPFYYLGIQAQVPWPGAFVGSILVYLLVYYTWPRLRAEAHWLVAGRIDRRTLAWMLPVIVGSSGALIGWVLLFRPDLSDLTSMMPTRDIATIVLGGAAFSIFNAIWEEFMLKGILWNGLERVFTRPGVTNLVQAALFGLLHVAGFPRGWFGVLMAGVYGWLLGFIRSSSGGMLAPIVTHVFADATIFVILYLVATGGIPVK